ncbi:MAG: hypothetical protein Aurels2KO_11790 [Aureliella sp.]
MKIYKFLFAALVIAFASQPLQAGIVLSPANANFEAGDTSGWQTFPTANSTFGAINSPAADVFAGTFSGRIENLATGSAHVIKLPNMGAGVVTPGQEITISFQAKGSGVNGGVTNAEFFSELAGGGTSKTEILGNGPLALTDTYQLFSFNTTAGTDVSGGVTLQFAVATGAAVGSTSTLFLDNISVSAVPEPSSMALLGLSGFGLAFRRRR